MTRPREREDGIDALTGAELDALDAFGDLVDASCAPQDEFERETKESTMHPEKLFRWNPSRIMKFAAAASIVAAIASLVAVLWPSTPTASYNAAFDTHPLMSLAVQERGPRMAMLVGLDDVRGARIPELEYQSSRTYHTPRAGQKRMPPTDGYAKFEFDLEAANAQREAAIRAGRLDPKGYKPGQSYQLQGKDRPLPVYWKPWAPGAVVQKLKTLEKREVTIEAAVKALNAARKGEEHDASLVMGGWVYAPPRWYGADKPSFSERDIEGVVRSTSYNGRRAVDFSLKKNRRADFEKYTGELVDCAMVLVVDDMLITNPVVKEALSQAVQITVGGSGFTEAEQEYLVRALSGDVPGKGAKDS